MSASSFQHLQASRKQWWLVVTSGFITILFGTLGGIQYDEAYGHTQNGYAHFSDGFYHSVQMLILHTPHYEHGTNISLEIGRWFGAITIVLTTVMLLWRRLRRELKLMQLAWWSDHHIICGLGHKGIEVARYLKQHDRKARVVVIDPHPDERFVHECEALGMCVIAADATDTKTLRRVRAVHAREIVAITAEDETNVRIATKVHALTAEHGDAQIACHVHLSNIHLREGLQRLAETDGSASHRCRLHFFDVYDDEARRVLLAYPLDGKGIRPGSATSVHIVILGLGRMGRSVLLRAAKMGHLANRKLLRISVIDRNAKQQEENLLFHYPALATEPICKLEFHPLEAQSLAARHMVQKWAAEPDTLPHIFACLDTNADALEVGLRLQEALIDRPDCNLFVRIKSHTSLADILQLKTKFGPRITAFGMVEDACSNEAFRREHNEAIAHAIHAEFVASRESDSTRTAQNDPAMRDWEDLREELREANRQQADHIAIKLRALGCELAPLSDPREAVSKFTPVEVEVIAELEHARWNAERWLNGWRKGVPSDKTNRITEYLVAWDELTDEIKKYDRDTVTKIPALLGYAKPPLKVVRQ